MVIFAIKFDLRHYATRKSKMINAKEKSAAEIARENCNNDWRSDFPTLFDRFKRLCLSDEFSDVDFVFNKGLSTETVWIGFFLFAINIRYSLVLFLANSCPFLCSYSCIRSFWEVFCLWWRWKETPGFISKLSEPFKRRWVAQSVPPFPVPDSRNFYASQFPVSLSLTDYIFVKIPWRFSA